MVYGGLITTLLYVLMINTRHVLECFYAGAVEGGRR